MRNKCPAMRVCGSLDTIMQSPYTTTFEKEEFRSTCTADSDCSQRNCRHYPLQPRNSKREAYSCIGGNR